MPSPVWLSHLLALHDQDPLQLPAQLANLLMAHHDVETTGAHVQRLLDRFRPANDHQQEAAA